MIKTLGLFTTSFFVALLLIASQPSASLVEEACERIVKSALETTDQICSATNRNQACYGHDMLEAIPQARAETFRFESAGDVVDVSLIKTLRLSKMDVNTGTWGVALLNLQANLPDEEPSQNVSLLLFGDVQINNLIQTPTELDVTTRSQGNANIRRLPSNEAFVMGTLRSGDVVRARGRSEDNQWIYIDVPDSEQRGWVYAPLMRVPGGLDRLSVIDPGLVEYGPMQAFYVRTGRTASSCEEAPNDGLLIQTPEGAGEVRLWINEVRIRLGSTIFITAQENQQMTISTLEGHADVEAQGVTYTAVEGTTVSVPMDANLKPAAPPRPPKPYTEKVSNLPVDHLQRDIDTAPAQNTPQILATLATPVTATPTATDVPTVAIPTATNVPTIEPTATFTPVIPTNPPPTATMTEEPPTIAPPTAESTSEPSSQGSQSPSPETQQPETTETASP